MAQSITRRPSRALFASAAILCSVVLTAAVNAQVVIPPGTPQIGSSNTVSADAPVPRPLTKPCTVELFQNLEFADFSNKTFSYTPPAGCHGPWSKVVFTADFTVTEGRQFDRTTQFYIDNVNIFYGTTAEPRSTLSPSWHVERDVTDLSAIFKSAQTGEAVLGNLVNSTYTGIIYANAALEFYPANFLAPALPVPDVVLPLPAAQGGAAQLNTTTSELTQQITLPTNTESLFLDVIAQSQSADEQWFLCVPNDVSVELETCSNTGFRETEVSVDGQAAGVAPVYPWIYTGGVDPYLWEPIPGLQTLNFKPYRVNLTPFAGLFADGKQHTVALSVYNANSYFLVDATLLAYLDHGSKTVRGGILSNTLSAAPDPVVTENLKSSNGTVSGTVSVTSARSFSISGYVQTSHGRIQTTISQQVNFSNDQQFVVSATQDVQSLTQSNTVDTKTTTRDGFLVTENEKHFSYPFTFSLTEDINPDNSISGPNVSDQKYLETETQSIFGIPIYKKTVANEVASTDTDTLVPGTGGYSIGSHTGQKSSQNYFTEDSLGLCYSETLTAANSALTGHSFGQGCPANKNRW